MIDKFASEISYRASIFTIGIITLLIIFKLVGFDAGFFAGALFLISPVIGLILLVAGIVGIKTGISQRKAIWGIITGAVFIVFFIISFLKIYLWFESMGGAFPLN